MSQPPAAAESSPMLPVEIVPERRPRRVRVRSEVPPETLRPVIESLR